MGGFNQRRCLQGLDGLNFECMLGTDNVSDLNTPTEEMTNQNKKVIVRIQCKSGEIEAYINPVHAIRRDNITPFGLADMDCQQLVGQKL